jgi:hypothetical protein
LQQHRGRAVQERLEHLAVAEVLRALRAEVHELAEEVERGGALGRVQVAHDLVRVVRVHLPPNAHRRFWNPIVSAS